MTEFQTEAHGSAAADYAGIAAALSRYLRGRASILFSDHDDLIQQTLLDFYRRSVDMPQPRDAEEARQIAFAILRRRITDRYRQVTRSVVSEKFSDATMEAPQGGDVTAAVSYQLLLQKVLSLIAQMSPRDQDLMLDHSQPSSRLEPWTPAERKQISRLREHLRRSLADEFKINIGDELRNEE